MSELKEKNIKLLDYVKEKISFLVEEHEFEEKLEQEVDNLQGGAKYYFLRYTNEEFKRQLEVLLHRNSDFILVTLKRIVDAKVPDYYDLVNTINIKDLDLFHSPDEFSFQKHIVYSEDSKVNYFSEITVKLKNEWLNYLKGSQWFDRNEIDHLYKTKGFLGASGFRKDELLLQIENNISFLKEYHYKVIENSNSKDPFRSVSNKCLILYNENKDIFLNFNINYKDQILSFKKRKSANQDYRLLNFVEIKPGSDNLIVEEVVQNWINSELENDGV